MAFFQDPQVDDASKRSDDSVTALKGFFSQRNGFICRPLNPDTGGDFIVELITEDKNARNWHFVIQLKSILKPAKIKNDQFISYPFETSRLGYLARQIPNLGMVVFYDCDSGECYFEYVSEITKKLYENKGNSDWEKQETVNIHIPLSNKLDISIVQRIHSRQSAAFKDAARMNDAFGHRYGLPRTGMKYADDEFDLNSPQGIVAFLLKNGTDLLIEYEFGIISTLIGKLTETEILAHTKILCMAAVAKCEAGKFDESHILCRKALKRGNLTEDDEILILYEDIKNRFKLGKINLNGAAKEMDLLRQRNLSLQNLLTLTISFIQTILANSPIGIDVPDTYRKDIFDVYEKINAAQLSSRVKFLLRLWNSDNFSLFINMTFMHEAKNAVANGYSAWVKAMLRVNALDRQLMTLLDNIKRNSSEDNGKLVRAYTLQIWIKHILTREIDCLLVKPDANNFAGFEGNLQENINFAITSYNYFLEEGMANDAYLSLCFGLEFLELGRYKLRKELHQNIPSLYEIKKAMEDEMITESYKLQIPLILEASGFLSSSKVEIGINFTREQLDQLEPLITRSVSLPADQIANAISEIDAYQEFFRRCNNPNVELCSVYFPIINQPAYSQPVRYVLRHRTSGIESAPNFNISALLTNWGF